MNTVTRREVFYSGHVQGVGFRYQVLQIAKEFEISGSVQNLLDGRVHLIVEGLEANAEGFTKEISYQMDAYIKEEEMHQSEQESELSGFKIL